MKVNKDCIVCPGQGAVIRKDFNMEDMKTCDIVRCQDCGLEYVFPMLIKKELDEVFANYDDFRADTDILRKNALRKIKYLSENHGIYKESKLLDFGCGKNAFVEVAQSPNWVGYDKYALFKENMTKKYDSQEWDCITMWGVLAHFPNPKETFGEITSHLKKDGIIALTDLVTDSKIPYQYRYEHVTWWNKSSMEALFSSAGLKMVEYKPYKMIQKPDIYLRSVLRTVPDEHKAKISHNLPDFIEVPTNESFVIGVK